MHSPNAAFTLPTVILQTRPAWKLPGRGQNKTILHLDVAAENLGNFGFNCREMETIARSNKNVTIVLYRNDTFGWIN
jgi:hypothetical protein